MPCQLPRNILTYGGSWAEAHAENMQLTSPLLRCRGEKGRPGAWRAWLAWEGRIRLLLG